MRKTHNIQILKVDNGFYINSVSDEPTANRKLIAQDENDMRTKVKGIVDGITVNNAPATGGQASATATGS